MKHQALFSSKDKSKKNSVVCCKFLFGALLVKVMCSLLAVQTGSITVVLEA